MGAGLVRVRNRVLAGVRLRKGTSVLDVGAGTGLLALEAGRRVGVSGTVIALDVSLDALCECHRAMSGESMAARLTCVVGDVVALPLLDGCVDAVIARSVLIYVTDKSSAARDVLGAGADQHLAALATSLDSQSSTSVSAAAFLRCRRARR
jgi:ubiquinone/menaquinone biosynthesis C-methylase UbiE